MIKTTPSDFRLQTSDFIYAEDSLKDFRRIIKTTPSDFRLQTSDFRLHLR